MKPSRISKFPRLRGQRVGVYGGSFNPAHDGHVHVSRAALAALGLDQILWLVTPGNPLKQTPGSSLSDRLDSACQLVGRDRRILVTDIEKYMDTRFTADTVTALQHQYPGVQFVWIMGADNLLQFPRWRRWQDLVMQVPIAVFSRPSYSYQALAGRAARYMAKWRVSASQRRSFVAKPAPAWGFFWLTRCGLSSTDIRAKQDNEN